MKLKLDRVLIEKWLAERSTREAWMVFLASLAVVYFLWGLIMEMPLRHQREKLQQQSLDLSKQIETQKQHLAAIESVIASTSFSRTLEKHQQLHSKFQRLGEEFKKIEATVIPVASLSQVSNQIIAQPLGVTLVSLRTLPSELWLKTPEAKQSLPNLQGVQQQIMELEFRGGYFDAITFFTQLEKLPWHLYWDRLEYQVLAYPEAKVFARFYVLSEDKDQT